MSVVSESVEKVRPAVVVGFEGRSVGLCARVQAFNLAFPRLAPDWDLNRAKIPQTMGSLFAALTPSSLCSPLGTAYIYLTGQTSLR